MFICGICDTQRLQIKIERREIDYSGEGQFL